MSCCNNNLCKYNILPLSILLLYLLQIYSQYTTFTSLRTKVHNEMDGRESLINYNLIKGKQYNFNLDKASEAFDDNILIQIPLIKNMAMKYFEVLVNQDSTIDKRCFKMYFLFLFDLIVLVIIYLFLYNKIWAGITVIILQAFRIYFGAKRLKTNNPNLSLYYIIVNKISNFYDFRGWDIFNADGFSVIEFGCNILIFLEVIYLFIILKDKKNGGKKVPRKITNVAPDKDFSESEGAVEEELSKENNKKTPVNNDIDSSQEFKKIPPNLLGFNNENDEKTSSVEEN